MKQLINELINSYTNCLRPKHCWLCLACWDFLPGGAASQLCLGYAEMVATASPAPLDLNQPSPGGSHLKELSFEATAEVRLSFQTQGWTPLSPYQRMEFAGNCSLRHPWVHCRALSPLCNWLFPTGSAPDPRLCRLWHHLLSDSHTSHLHRSAARHHAVLMVHSAPSKLNNFPGIMASELLGARVFWEAPWTTNIF